MNISTRGFVGTGDDVMIGGFFVNGPDQMTILIRAQGPSLAGSVPGVLSNPTMQLYSGATVIAQNDDWQTTDPLCLNPAISCGNEQNISDTGLDPCTAGNRMYPGVCHVSDTASWGIYDNSEWSE